jgi:hypothetical protein
MQKVGKSHLRCVEAIGDVILDEGGLGYSAIHNQERGRSDSHSETEDTTPRSGRGGPRLDENGKNEAPHKSAGEKLRSGAFVLGSQALFVLKG